MKPEIKRLERKRTILNWFEAILYAAFIIFCIWLVSHFTPAEKKQRQVIEHSTSWRELNKYSKQIQ